MPIIPVSGSAVAHGAVVPIASSVVTGTTTTDITFTNVPQIYQDLMLVFYSRRTDAAMFSNAFITPYYSGIPASPQSATGLQYDQVNGLSSFRYSNQDALYAGITSASFAAPFIYSSTVWHCLNYTNTIGFKPSIIQSSCDANGNGVVRLTVAATRGTGAMTTVNCSTFSASIYYAPGTTATLYGIRSINQ